MKTIIFLVLVTFASLHSQNLDSLNKFTGWENKGDYTEQKLKIGPITYSKMFDNGKYLFTADSNKYFRIWDLESGKIVMMDNLGSYNRILFYKDSSIIFTRSTKSDSTSFYTYNFSQRVVEFASTFYNGFVNFDTPTYLWELVNGDIGIGFHHSKYDGQTKTTYTYSRVYEPSNFIENKLKISENVNYIFNTNTKFQLSDYYHLNQYFYSNSGQERKEIVLTDSLGKNKDFKLEENMGRFIKSFNNKGDGFYFKNELSNLRKVDIFTGKEENYYYPFDVQNIYPLTDKIIIAPNNSGRDFILFNEKNGLSSSIKINIEDAQINIHNDEIHQVFYETNNHGKIKKFSYDIFKKVFAKFEPETKTINTDQPVRFTNKSQFTSNKFYWEFGDGGTSTDENPTYFYKFPGVYNVKLTVWNDFSTDTYNLDSAVTVKQIYHVMLKADKYQGIDPLTIKINYDLDFDADSIKWKLNDLNYHLVFNNLVLNKGMHKLELIAYKDSSKYSTTKYFEVFSKDSVFIQRSAFTIEANFSYPEYERDGVAILGKNVDDQMVFVWDQTKSHRLNQTSTSVRRLGLMDNLGRLNKTETLDFNDINLFLDGGYIVKNNQSSLLLFNNQLKKLGEFNPPGKFSYFPHNNKMLIGLNLDENCIINRYFEKIFSFDCKTYFLDNYNDKISYYHYNLNFNSKDYYYIIYGSNKGIYICKFNNYCDLINLKFYKNLKINDSYFFHDSCFVLKENPTGFLYLFDNNFELKSIKKYNFNYLTHLKNGYFVSFGGLKLRAEGENVFTYYILNSDSNIVYQNTDYFKDKYNSSLLNKAVHNDILFINTNYGWDYNCGVYGYRFFFNWDKILSPSDVESKLEKTSILPYPNPATTELRINANAFELKSVVCYDMIGVRYPLEMIEKSQNYTVFDVGHLPMGVYMLVINDGDKIQNVKFVKE